MTTESPTKDNLNQLLHPEWIQSRHGPNGKRLFYVESDHVTKLADTMFGPDGWTRQVKHTVTDVCQVATNGAVMVAVAATVRVTLQKSGSFHEDIGYGTGDHPTVKAIALERACIVAGSDGMKRALRKFGNVLGNCLYDTGYLQGVDASVPPPPPAPSRSVQSMIPLPSPISITAPYHHKRLQPLDPFSPTCQSTSITVQQQPPLTTCDKEQVLAARRKRQRAPIKKEASLETTMAQQPSSTTVARLDSKPKPSAPQRRPRTTATTATGPHQPVTPLSLMTCSTPPNPSSPPRRTLPFPSARTTTTVAKQPTSTAAPRSLATRAKQSKSLPPQQQPPPPPRSPVTLDTNRPRLVAQDSFPFDEQDEAWFIEMTNAQTDIKLLQRTCRENSHSSPTQTKSPSHD